MKKGTQVKVKYDGTWYPGEVVKVFTSGKLKVEFEDGDTNTVNPEEEDLKTIKGGKKEKVEKKSGRGGGITAKTLDFSKAEHTLAEVLGPKSKYAKAYAKKKGNKKLFKSGKIARGDMVGIMSFYIAKEDIAE